MNDLTVLEMIVLRNLVHDHWPAFVAECEEYEGVIPEEVYVKLGGENGDH